MKLGERRADAIELQRRHARLERGGHCVHRLPHDAAGVLQCDQLFITLDGHARSLPNAVVRVAGWR